VEKFVRFADVGSNVFYAYSSYIPKDTGIKPPQPDCDRTRNFFRMIKIYRRPSDKRIVFTMLFQSEVNQKISTTLLNNQIP
jgi:hypothetical protein